MTAQNDLNQLFRLNRWIMKAFCLKESLEELWSQPNAIAAATYLNSWVRRLRWQRSPSFEKLARMLLNHREGLLNYLRSAFASDWSRRSMESSDIAQKGSQISQSAISAPQGSVHGRHQDRTGRFQGCRMNPASCRILA